MVKGDKSKKSAINVEEKCDIDEEMPVEQPVDIANAKNAMATLISADGKNDDNTDLVDILDASEVNDDATTNELPQPNHGNKISKKKIKIKIRTILG
ncbi:ATP-binding cassette sub-family F member 1 isoform X2 [Aphis craccivora]|uniref:ATP-binding cassette sub-family F member 1 isoform X2 n=1 Tax=Aphis craccivora TaxID=307492 RepID=A0A6G0XYF1_APHCR|nr:ATP-binding cassette sub-family F member 1 isoform X2 [Aphis craccivora]